MAANNEFDFPFDILWVAEQCGLLTDKTRRHGSEVSVCCPLDDCDGKRQHLSINAKKGIWQCFKCGNRGGLLDLYAFACNVSRNTACAELYKIWNAQSPQEAAGMQRQLAARREKLEREAPKEVLVPIERRDTAYRALLAYLKLTDEHKANLLGRGLTEADIERCGFKSLVVEPKRVIHVPDTLDTEGVAGFYTRKGRRCVNTDSQGILIPYRDLYGRIEMMEIRTFGGSTRYLRFTSGSPTAENGRTDCTKSVTAVHHVGIDPKNPPKKVYLTEGALKAYVANSISGKPFIAVAGVNNPFGLENALRELKAIGVEKIVLAFDMDLYTNPNVLKGLKNAITMIDGVGLEHATAKWDKHYKGIDDYFCALKNKEV